jgi:CheY-like chemotaxis protein
MPHRSLTPATAPEAATQTATFSEPRPVKVLLVEDEPNFAKVVMQYLSSGAAKKNVKIEIEHTMTVDGALHCLGRAEAERRPYDFAVLDYCLPQKRGIVPTPSLTLADVCRRTPTACVRTIQLTSHTESAALIGYWGRLDPQQLPEMLLFKDADAMKKLLQVIIETGLHEPVPAFDDEVCLPFRVLLVSKEDRLKQEMEAAVGGLEPYYRPEIQTKTTALLALAAVNQAAVSQRGFDLVVVDTATDDLQAGSEQLSQIAQICAERESRCANVFLLKEKGSSVGRSHNGLYHILIHEEAAIQQAVTDLKFIEIKRPLHSVWLAEYLGETAGGTWKPRAPKGFSLPQFTSRLQLVWHDLDEASKKRARELFAIDEPAPDMNPVIQERVFGRKLSMNL